MPDGAQLEFAVQFHPLADLFPLMQGAEFDNLVADIKANGLRTPIVEMGNQILDGRNRYRACMAAGVSIRAEKFKGKDALAYVLSANLHRRHLNESQRGMVASKLATMGKGQPKSNAQICALSQPDAAALLHVGRRTVQDAKIVRDHGSAELVARVESGEVAVSLAAKVAKLPKSQQDKLAGADEATLRSAEKKASRSSRETALAENTKRASASLGAKLYSVIYADPPWRFEPWSDNGMDRAADNHYPTLTVDGIGQIKPPAANDCVLFMWATAPMLPEALSVLRLWGFSYKTHFVWAKDRVGTGYWCRSKHELLLVATRGNIPAPAPGEQYESVISAAVGKHSEKPIAFSEMIEEMFPNNVYLEMFARTPRVGWDVWGNEAP